MSDEEPAWLDRRLVLAVHGEQIREHGGATGIRDEGLLESALARPQNQFVYTGSAMPELAALYGMAIAQNHPFIDGNERSAYVALELFVDMNAHDFIASDAEAVVTMVQLASGEISDEDFVAWVVANARLRT